MRSPIKYRGTNSKSGAKGSGQVRNLEGDTDAKIVDEDNTKQMVWFKKAGKDYIRFKQANLTMRFYNTKKGLVLREVLPEPIQTPSIQSVRNSTR